MVIQTRHVPATVVRSVTKDVADTIAPVEVTAVLATVIDTAFALDHRSMSGQLEVVRKGPPGIHHYPGGSARASGRSVQDQATASASSGIGTRLASVTISTSFFVCLSIFASPRSASTGRLVLT